MAEEKALDCGCTRRDEAVVLEAVVRNRHQHTDLEMERENGVPGTMVRVRLPVNGYTAQMRVRVTLLLSGRRSLPLMLAWARPLGMMRGDLCVEYALEEILDSRLSRASWKSTDEAWTSCPSDLKLSCLRSPVFASQQR